MQGALQGIATTTLRAVIGGISLDDALSEREHINTMLRTRLERGLYRTVLPGDWARKHDTGGTFEVDDPAEAGQSVAGELHKKLDGAGLDLNPVIIGLEVE